MLQAVFLLPGISVAIQRRESEAIQLSLADEHDQRGDPLQVGNVKGDAVPGLGETGAFAAKVFRVARASRRPRHMMVATALYMRSIDQ